ncbi:MAG TPA: hypothetical protein VNT75_19440, partial [Symbiobacteriaceae bacterium]|nr:hypothetical protein [Symbiobacteriaceae bacterium]
MQKRWIWAAAAVLTAVVAVTGTVYGERAFRYADRRFGWTEAGRSAEFDALWLRAESEYTARSPKDRYGFYMADYPAKAELLAQPDRVLARLEAVPHDFFEMDLMMALGRAQAGALVQADLERGRCYVTREYLQAFYTADELKRLAVSELPATCRSSAWYA